jgi:hypothetical protein
MGARGAHTQGRTPVRPGDGVVGDPVERLVHGRGVLGVLGLVGLLVGGSGRGWDERQDREAGKG